MALTFLAVTVAHRITAIFWSGVFCAPTIFMALVDVLPEQRGRKNSSHFSNHY
jgi:hypothetical protein